MRPALRRPLTARLRDPESGSAYIITLLALVVLTILGLSLSLITQSELTIGANERVQKRTFYAADSGISLSLARALTNGDYTATQVRVDDAGSDLAAIGFDISLSPLLPISYPPCNLCEINNRGNYANDRSFNAADFAVTVEATRRVGNVGAPLAQKTVSSMLQIQPIKLTTDALKPLDDNNTGGVLEF